MGQPYVGEIRMFAGNFAPAGWMLCQGQILPISEYETLFVLIGTTYGGDGQDTFALPNLQSRVPIHQGTGGNGTYIIGETGGVESVTLTVNQIPLHSHPPLGQSGNGSSAPGGGVWATSTQNIYTDGTPAILMNPQAIGQAGGNQPHDNMMPYLGLNFIISLFGIFPSPT